MKKVMTFIIMLALFFTGCGAELQAARQEKELTQVVSDVSAEDCFLCGNGAGEPFYWEENNVGIISLNTFEVMPIEINRYDNQGGLIEKNVGNVQARGFQASEDGFSTYMMVVPDGGYATGQISFREDEVLNVEKIAAFLCQDCLDAVLSKIHKDGSSVGLINFETRKIRVFETCLGGFWLGDYYADCDWKEQKKTSGAAEMELLLFYHPPRYLLEDE